MNDNLDKTLEAWKEQRTPKDAQFESEEKFAADFFEKAAQLPSKKNAKKSFWPIVCKLAACLVVVLCISFILLKLNGMKRTESRHNVSIAKVPQNELVKEMKQQVEEAEEVVAEAVASKPVMAKATSKARLADSDGGLALKPSQSAPLPVTAPLANAPIVVNDDAIALDGNGELRVLKTKQIGNMNITGLDGANVENDSYLVDNGYDKANEETAGNDFLTDDDMADIANDSYNKANEYIANKVLESQALDFSLTNTGGNVDIMSFGTALTVGENAIAGNANVTTNMEKAGYYQENIGDETAIKVDTADVADKVAADTDIDVAGIVAADILDFRPYQSPIDIAGRDVADILGDTSYISEIKVNDEDTVALYYDGKDLAVKKKQVSTSRKDLHVSTTSTSSNDLAVRKKQVSAPRKDLHVSAASTSSNDLAVRKRQVSTPSSLNTEEYKNVGEKPFLTVSANPLSTFSADVDTSGYGMMRRMILQDKRLPLPNTVRIEELLNYFHYDYPMPEKDDMMRPHFEMQAAPWNPSHQLLLVGVQAKKIPVEELPREARKIFIKGMTGNMVMICRDVKFQLEFNPSKVFAYRQLGYELREMASSDFRNDAKDSGDVGMGQQVTVLYELVPAEASEDIKKQAVPGWQPLKYAKTKVDANDEWLTLRMRYKLPQGDAPAVEKTTALTNPPGATDNWNWAASVAETALKLRRSRYAGDANYERAAKRAQAALGDDADGHRAEFLLLIRRMQELDTK